jgi:cytoskeletal protein CcmA (bactofilin family)
MIRRSAKLSFSRIGAGADASGKLEGEGRLDVLGALRGELSWDGTIAIGPEATVEVRGRAGRIELNGILRGDVEAAEAFVSRRGSWSGRGAIGEMATEDGARLEGEFRFGPLATVAPESTGP